MYGVIVCTRCEKARAVNLSQKTSTCECGTRIDLQQSKVYYRNDSQRDVAEAVRQMNARISGAPLASLSDEIGTPGQCKDFLPALREFLRDSLKSRSQLISLLIRLGVRHPDRAVERLLAEGILYEPRKGYFRLV